eukprot:RCo027575
MTIFGFPISPEDLYTFISSGVFVEFTPRGNYYEPLGEYLACDRYRVLVAVGETGHAHNLSEKCVLGHPFGSSVPRASLDVRALVAHKLATLRWLNSQAVVEEAGLYPVLGLADREVHRVEVRLDDSAGSLKSSRGSRKVPAARPVQTRVAEEVEVEICILGPTKLCLLLLETPGVLHHAPEGFAVGLSLDYKDDSGLRIVRVTEAYRHCVVRLDPDRHPDKPTLGDTQPRDLSAALAEFNEVFESSSVHRALFATSLHHSLSRRQASFPRYSSGPSELPLNAPDPTASSPATMTLVLQQLTFSTAGLSSRPTAAPPRQHPPPDRSEERR